MTALFHEAMVREDSGVNGYARDYTWRNFALFPLIDTGNYLLIIVAITGGLSFLVMQYGPQAVFYTELLNPQRATSALLWAIKAAQYWAVHYLIVISPHSNHSTRYALWQ